MELQIRLFATLKDRAGQSQITVVVPEPATVQTVLESVTTAYPTLTEGLKSSIVSVNKAFAMLDTAVQPHDEIAIFPPVSGGSETKNAPQSALPYPTYFAITTTEPDINAIHKHLTQPDVGAIVSFAGSVRGQTSREGLPDQTNYLEYEAYSEMAELKMVQIAHEIWERWPLVKGIAIVQRIGSLAVGDSTTFVACAAAHRDQGAFEAARYGIDRLKEIVPVWKKEVGSDKTVWIEGHYHPTEQDN
jgi:molybdopterin synthase catalytic subunit